MRTRLEAASLLAAVLVVGLAGCRAHHYVVVEDGAPLYAGAQDDEVLTRLRRLHHEPLRGEPLGAHGRVRVSYGGAVGYAPLHAVKTFDYLDPVFDGGESRDAAIARALREAEVEAVGRGWSPRVREAVREGEVVRGMTRRQVEAAWGWPTTIERAPGPGAERWVYRSRTTRLVRHRSEALWAGDDIWGAYPDPIAWSMWRDQTASGGWITIHVPIVYERVVVIDAAGRVEKVTTRELPG